VKVLRADAAGVTVGLPGDTPVTLPFIAENVKAGDLLTFGIRPEHLTESAAGGMEGKLSGKVIVVEHLGGETLLHVNLEGDVLIQVKGSGESTATDGQSIEAGFGLRHVHLFRENGEALKRFQTVAWTAATA
jgi:multiple sugar transport system ATP-binding protein